MALNNIKAYIHCNPSFAVIAYGASDIEAIDNALMQLYCDDAGACMIKVVSIINDKEVVQYYCSVEEYKRVKALMVECEYLK